MTQQVYDALIFDGPDALSLAAALFGNKQPNNENSPEDINPKAIFNIGQDAENTSPCHVTVRSVKAEDEWGRLFQIHGDAILWSTLPIGYGGTTSNRRSTPVIVHYNLATMNGRVEFQNTT